MPYFEFFGQFTIRFIINFLKGVDNFEMRAQNMPMFG